MNPPTVLSLCDYTGIMVRPWLEAGYAAIIVDTRHAPGGHQEGRLTKIGADVKTWKPPKRQYAAAFAFPPCTHLARSGARWWRKKGLEALIDALQIVSACIISLKETNAPYCIENPVGSLSTYWRAPDYRFDPYQYAGYRGGENDTYTKRTCLWTGNGFRMPGLDARPVSGRNPMWDLPPSPERGFLRSKTPAGFAQAVFEANDVPSDLWEVLL